MNSICTSPRRSTMIQCLQIRHNIQTPTERDKIIRDMAENTFSVKEQWDLELNVTAEDRTWEDMCMSSHKGITCNVWKEFDWKTRGNFNIL